MSTSFIRSLFSYAVNSSRFFELEAHNLVMNQPVLSYWNAAPPVAVLIASRIGGVPLKRVPWTEQRSPATATLTFDDGTKLFGVHSILRFIARRSSKSANLYGTDALASVLVRPVFIAHPCSERCAAFTARSSQKTAFVPETFSGISGSLDLTNVVHSLHRSISGSTNPTLL